MSIFNVGKESVIGIDIGYRNIKIVEIENENDGSVYLKNYGLAPTPRESIKNGHIRDMGKICSAILRIFKENDIKSKNARIVMSGTHIASRLMTIKVQPNIVLDDLVKELAVRNFPAVSIDTHDISYKVLDKQNSEGMVIIRLFILVILKSIINSYLNVILELGLKPLSIDVPSYSAEIFFKMKLNVDKSGLSQDVQNRIEQSKTFAVIDFGSETTIVSIFRNKIIEFNKPILRGSSNIDESIAKALARKISDAEQIKQEYGLRIPNFFIDSEINALKSAITDVVDDIVQKIVGCFEYYKQKTEEGGVDVVYIIGGGALLKGLREYLMEAMDIPVLTVDLIDFQGIKIRQDLDISKINFLINSVGILLK